jgi:hypothetical protein
MEHIITIGNEYRRTLGAVKQFVTITAFDKEVGKWQYTTKSGKIGTADDKTIEKWELLKQAEVKEVEKTVRAFLKEEE